MVPVAATVTTDCLFLENLVALRKGLMISTDENETSNKRVEQSLITKTLA